MGRLVLTHREKAVVLFVITAFLLGLGVKYYRDHHRPAAPAPETKHTMVDSRIFVAVSEPLARAITNDLKLPSSKVTVLANGVRHREPAPLPAARIEGSAGMCAGKTGEYAHAAAALQPAVAG